MKKNITVFLPDSSVKICYTPSEDLSLKDILADNDILLNSDCGGHGICGRCKVNIVSIQDNEQQGSCSCRFYPKDDLVIHIPKESLLHSASYNDPEPQNDIISHTDNVLSAAIDLGSTTISVSLLNNGSVADTATFFNPTIRYGSDIISRQQIQQKEGRSDEFSKLLKKTLTDALKKITSKNHYSFESLRSVCISGNTTMQHFLYGRDTTSLSSYPFEADKLSYDPFLEDGICIKTIPSFSTFIGGDIVSGLYYLQSGSENSIRKPFLFLDLGTNAEIVLATKKGYICTSAAAGPAFEGTNISCGCAAIPGAIKHIRIANTRRLSYETIGNKLPTGICGSGILSLYSELIKNNIIDDNKTVPEEYLGSGFPVAKTQTGMLNITQQDIRELQLAISAIKTGIQILLKEADLSISDMEHIYISGSFGKALDADTISGIGLLPGMEAKNYAGRIIFSGNTSLMGAENSLSDPHSEENMHDIISCCREVHMAGYPGFNEIFLSNI